MTVSLATALIVGLSCFLAGFAAASLLAFGIRDHRTQKAQNERDSAIRLAQEAESELAAVKVELALARATIGQRRESKLSIVPSGPKGAA